MHTPDSELLRQVKAQVAMMRSAREDSTAGIDPIWRLAPLDELFERDSEVTGARPDINRLTVLPRQDSYRASELLFFEDADFLDKAYHAILRRAPDPEGKAHFLAGLSDGRLDKIDILWRLRYSPEGRRKGVPIRGVWIHLLIRRLYRIRFLGVVIRWLVAVVQLPIILRNWEQDRYRLLANYDFLRDTLKRHQAIDDKVRSSDLEMLHGRLDEIAESVTYDQRLSVNLAAQEEQLERQLDKLERNFLERINAIEARHDGPDRVSSNLECLAADYYYRLEQRFRGSEELITERLSVYLPYLPDSREVPRNAVDLGCGRGEWLALLLNHGFDAVGVDHNADFVSAGRDRGLNIVEQDALDYLRSLPDKSVGVITAFHVVEHLKFPVLLALMAESRRVIAEKGLVILETPNPESLIVGACNFYLDPTHERPLPPILLEHVMENAGFRHVEIRRLHPYAPTADSEDYPETSKTLHNVIFGKQDYAIFSKP